MPVITPTMIIEEKFTARDFVMAGIAVGLLIGSALTALAMTVATCHP